MEPADPRRLRLLGGRRWPYHRQWYDWRPILCARLCGAGGCRQARATLWEMAHMTEAGYQPDISVFRPDRPGIRKVLGDLEAEIMEAVWPRPDGRGTTVRDVFEVLYDRRRAEE